MKRSNRIGLPSGAAVCAALAMAIVLGLAPRAKAQMYQNQPFDAAAAALPTNFYGYDPEAFVEGYEDMSAKQQRDRQKGEFETTEAYEKRLKGLDASDPFTGGTYAFGAAPTALSYDADTQTFTLGFSPSPGPVSGVDNWTHYASVLLKNGAKDMGHYQAENGFGAVFRVERSLFSSYYLMLSITKGPIVCTASVKVPIADAKDLKPDIRAILIVRPAPPYVNVDSSVTEATFTDPSENTAKTAAIFGRLQEVRFYDSRTGKALASCP